MDFKEEKIDKSQMVGFSKLLQFCDRKHMIFVIIGTFSAITSGLGQPLFIIFIQDLYDSFSPNTDPQVMVDESKRIGLLYLYIGLGLWVLCYFYLAFWGMVSEYTGGIFRVKYLSAVLRQDVSWFDQNDAQSLPSKISKESTAIQIATGEKFANILMGFSMSLSGYIIGFTLGWEYALASLASFPLTGLIIFVFILILQWSYKAGQEAFKMSSTYAEQALNAIKVVVAFGQEQKEINRFEKYLEKARLVGIRGHFYNAIGYALNNGAVLLVFAYGMYIGAIFVHNSIYNDIKGRNYTAGDTIAIFFGIIFGTIALGIGAPNFKALAQGRVAGKTILDTIERKPAILIDDPEASKVDKLNGYVELQNITFSYPLKKVSVLNNLSIKFEKGKSTAIVGHSGSGKSTIVQLIERFYDPQEGVILIDGKDLKNINLRDFRSKVGYVGQEPVLFNQTIRENLLYGDPKATEEDMLEALKKANASKIIDKLPLGIDTIVGSGGGQLSGGEKQRIALARAFIKNPSILILDEATSALDRQNEKEVQVAIDNLRTKGSDITTIIIAHRLSTIKNCDKIFVLREGELVEEGTHRSILEEHPDGVYSDLVRTQEILENLENEDNKSQDKEMNWIDEQHHSEDASQPLIQKLISRKSSTHQNIKNKFEEANKIDEEIEKEKKDFLESMKKKGYFKRLLKYNKPYYLIGLGLICSAIQGMTTPVFGIYYGKCIFTIFSDDFDKSSQYCLILVIISAISLVATYFQ